MMKISQKFQSKKRGVTPVIATVLLIGLVVIAGIGVAIVMFGTITAPDPIDVEIESISNFETTDKDFLVDRFKVSLQNKERTSVRIQSDAFKIFLQNGTEKEGWEINQTQDEFILPGLGTLSIRLSCDPTDNRNELSPNNDTIYIKVTVFPEGSSRNEKTYRSTVLFVGDTTGPIYLTSYISESKLTSGGLNISFDVANFGSTDRYLFLEFTTDSSDIYFVINNRNKTRYYFSLTKYSNTTFSSDIFTVKPEASISPGLVLIEVWLWDEESSTQISFALISLTYEP